MKVQNRRGLFNGRGQGRWPEKALWKGIWLHATRHYLVAEIVVFGMEWFDSTQTISTLKGKCSSTCSLALHCPARGMGKADSRSICWEMGKGTCKEASTNIIPLTTQHLQSCPPWKCHTSCIASCAARTFCPKRLEWSSRTHHEPRAVHGQAHSRPLTYVLRGVPVFQPARAS